MPDVCRANGFSETLKIGHIAAAHQLLVSPHVVHELSVHVSGALANGYLVEYMDWMPPDLFAEVPRPDPVDSLVRIPERPGHGMTLTADAERKYRLR
jgi:L-alanine-DL-glutamate epimerase-like enolase superfamily enzyme